MLIGGPCICPHPLRNGSFDLRSGGEVVATVSTDNHGRFSLSVAVGRYRLATAPTKPYPIRPRAVEVSAGRTTRVRLRFGIF
jgi:hypothetical protein